jgi:hypothetical protein
LKTHFLIFIIVFLFSCKKERTFSKPKLNNVEYKLSLENEKTKNHINVEQECIFDQSTQTDAFLKGIKELEDYTWDNESKSTEIVLNDHWFLTITRGGCDHFLLSAEFLYDRNLEFKDNKQEILEKIIWITSLLKEEFEFETIKKCIEEDKMTFTETTNGFYGNFMDSKIYEMYTFDYRKEKGNTVFGISYYLY